MPEAPSPECPDFTSEFPNAATLKSDVPPVPNNDTEAVEATDTEVELVGHNPFGPQVVKTVEKAREEYAEALQASARRYG